MQVFQVFNKKGDEMFWTKDTSQENGPIINNEGSNGLDTASTPPPPQLPLPPLAEIGRAHV